MNAKTVTYDIVLVKGHYEVYDEKGNFVTSGDTYKECQEELLDMAA